MGQAGLVPSPLFSAFPEKNPPVAGPDKPRTESVT